MIEYLESPANANQLGKFAHWLDRRGGALKDIIRSFTNTLTFINKMVRISTYCNFVNNSKASTGTVFAPSNSAFTATVESILDLNPERAKEILGMHFVDQWIAGDDVRIHKPQSKDKVTLPLFDKNDLNRNCRFHLDVFCQRSLPVVV